MYEHVNGNLSFVHHASCAEIVMSKLKHLLHRIINTAPACKPRDPNQTPWFEYISIFSVALGNLRTSFMLWSDVVLATGVLQHQKQLQWSRCAECWSLNHRLEVFELKLLTIKFSFHEYLVMYRYMWMLGVVPNITTLFNRVEIMLNCEPIKGKHTNRLSTAQKWRKNRRSHFVSYQKEFIKGASCNSWYTQPSISVSCTCDI